jgi:hypothetical protein
MENGIAYSKFIIHGPRNLKIIPFSEFVKTDQTVKQISIFLFLVKEFCL